MPPAPKPAADRRRRNRTPGARVLRSVGTDATPELPGRRAWCDETVEWWDALWRSPMAPEYDQCDRPSLLQLVMLVDEFNRAANLDGDGPDASMMVKLAAEIRLQRQCFGITPLDRRRLAWEIDRGEAAEDRRTTRATTRRPKAVRDPRQATG